MSYNSREVLWLLVGAGDIARKRVAHCLNAVPRCRLVAVCDPDRERAESVAQLFGCPEVYTDYGSALANTGANAVYVATPAYLHAGQAALALEAGKHVLVEKPLGVDEADAGIAVTAAAGKKLRAGCAYFRRFSARYRHLKSVLENGDLGRIVLVRMSYVSWFNPDSGEGRSWRVRKACSGGGPLADMGSHMFDLLIGLFGLPSHVFARAQTLVQPYEVEDSASVMLRLENGSIATGSFHWNSRAWSHRLEVIGTQGKVVWDPFDGNPVWLSTGSDARELDLPNAGNVHMPLVEDFAQAVLDGRDPGVTLSEAAKTNRLLDAVYRSATSGAEVAV